MKEIKLTNTDRPALVSDEDYERLIVHKWSMTNQGYARSSKVKRVDGKQKFYCLFMHQEVLGKKDGFVSDHINRDRLDNRRENLRFATKAQNMANLWRKGKNSRYKCVFKDWHKWYYSFQRKGKVYSGGGFNTDTEAAIAYNEAVIKVDGEFTLLNEV